MRYFGSCARFQAAIIIAFTQTSTGVKSAMLLGSHNMVRVKPIPEPTKIPTGPLKLSKMKRIN